MAFCYFPLNRIIWMTWVFSFFWKQIHIKWIYIYRWNKNCNMNSNRKILILAYISLGMYHRIPCVISISFLCLTFLFLSLSLIIFFFREKKQLFEIRLNSYMVFSYLFIPSYYETIFMLKSCFESCFMLMMNELQRTLRFNWNNSMEFW